MKRIEKLENNYIKIYHFIIYKNMIKVKRNNYIKIYPKLKLNFK